MKNPIEKAIKILNACGSEKAVDNPIEEAIAILSKIETPTVFINLSGGVIQEILADTEIHHIIIDEDTEGAESAVTIKDIDNTNMKVWLNKGKTEINKKVVNHFKKETKNFKNT